MDILENAELKMITSIETYENRLLTIRDGRANPQNNREVQDSPKKQSKP